MFVERQAKGKMPVPPRKAAAYYRRFAQALPDGSIPAQWEQVRGFAEESGIEVIEEFADHGKSGSTEEDSGAK